MYQHDFAQDGPPLWPHRPKTSKASQSEARHGNKGKQEQVQLIVPKDTNLVHRATKQDDAADKEQDLLKARLLQYEARNMS